MKKIATTLALGLLLTACKPCKAADDWFAEDKQMHFGGGAVIGLMTTLATKNKWHGIFAATVVGVGKEIYDSKHPQSHTADWKDAAATIAGGVLGAYIGQGLLVVTPRSVQYTIPVEVF